MTTIRISDYTHYVPGKSRNGGGYAYYETAIVKNGNIASGRHTTSSEFNYCEMCGQFEQRIEEHSERCTEYWPSKMMEGIVAALESGRHPNDILLEDGFEIEVI